MPRFRVNSLTGKTFRRNGLDFTGVPQVVDSDALGWTPEQVANLRAAAKSDKPQQTAALHVEDLDGPPPGTPTEAVVAAKEAGVSLPGHPSVEEAERTPPTGRGRSR